MKQILKLTIYCVIHCQIDDYMIYQKEIIWCSLKMSLDKFKVLKNLYKLNN